MSRANCAVAVDSTRQYSEYLNVIVTVSDNDIVIVNFKKLDKEVVKIRILDDNNTQLHVETVKDKSSIFKRYDISNLPNGIYSFEVSNEVFLMRKKIFKE